MKKLLIIIALSLSVGMANAQNATLTKQETVNYLNKKAQEVIGHYRTIPTDDNTKNIKYYYPDNSVSMSGDKVIFEMKRRNHKDGALDYSYYPCDYHEQKYENIFNPAHIISIEKGINYVNGEPIGAIKIILKAVGQENSYAYAPTKRVTNENNKHYGKCYEFEEYTQLRNKKSTKEVFFTYLQSDDTNFNKIKKALEYLRDLAKAEDDPFGG